MKPQQKNMSRLIMMLMRMSLLLIRAKAIGKNRSAQSALQASIQRRTLARVEEDEEVEEVKVPPTPKECLESIDRLMNMPLGDEESTVLHATAQRLEKSVIERKTQKTIKDYFKA